VNEKAEYIKTIDAAGNNLTGEKNYRMHLAPYIPACRFWSVIVYDIKTNLMICNDQPWPSVYSTCKKLHTNKDGSFDIWFGPEAPAGEGNNWIRTIRNTNWYIILRLYDLQEAGNDNIWKPGEIELLVAGH
jgi:hypothetical protein